MACGPVSVPCRGSKKTMRAIYLLRAASPRPGRARLRMLPAPDAVPPITCGDPDRLDDGSRHRRGRPAESGRAARPRPVRGGDARPDPRAGGPALHRLSQLRRRHPGEPARLDDRAPPRGPLPVLRHPLPERDLPRRRYPAGHEPPGRGSGVSLLVRRRRLPPLLPRPGLVRGPRVLRPPGPGPGAPPRRHRRPPPRPPRRPHPVALRRGLPGYCVHYDYPFRQKIIFEGDRTFPWPVADYRAAKWDWWAYMDIPEDLLQAYELVRPSGALDEAAQRRIEDDLFHASVAFVRSYPPALGNMDPTLLRGLITAGRVLGEPEYIHDAVRRIELLARRQFFADGAWREGAVSYHNQTVRGLDILARLLKGWTDPPGYIPGGGRGPPRRLRSRRAPPHPGPGAGGARPPALPQRPGRRLPRHLGEGGRRGDARLGVDAVAGPRPRAPRPRRRRRPGAGAPALLRRLRPSARRRAGHDPLQPRPRASRRHRLHPHALPPLDGHHPLPQHGHRRRARPAHGLGGTSRATATCGSSCRATAICSPRWRPPASAPIPASSTSTGACCC